MLGEFSQWFGSVAAEQGRDGRSALVKVVSLRTARFGPAAQGDSVVARMQKKVLRGDGAVGPTDTLKAAQLV